jgi:hypothetical protein
MKVIHKAIAREHIGTALLLLTFLAAAVPGATAKHRAVKSPVQPAAVIAHLELPGASVSQLVLQEHDNKQYLYIAQASQGGFAIVDVTKPDQPNVIKHLAWPNETPTGRLQLISGGLALAEGPDSDPMVAAPPVSTRTVKVFDFSDPANPRAVLSFSGVTSTFADDAHNLIYITNGEGLWILRNNQALAAAAKHHTCTSDDAYNDVARCQ